MRSLTRPAGLFIAAASIALAACSSAPQEESDTDLGADTAGKTDAPKLCAAVRGNGQSILTHFASLSRIIEHYGVIDGMAGGSSGSITTFTYESILKNPAMKGDPARIALALKSVQGYANVVGDSEEAASIKGLAAVAGKLKADVDAKGIGSLASDAAGAAEATKRLNDVLGVPELRALINPEVFKMLADQEHLAFNVNEIKASIQQLGAFSVDDNRLFFRSGILNWPALATMFGRVGDFYAGYGPSDKTAMGKWLDACAEPTRDKPWSEAASVAIPGGTCGSALESLVKNFRVKARASEGTYASRIDERSGDPASPLHKLVITAVVEGDAVAKYKAARARYVSGEFPNGSIPFTPSFSDVNFGYWGSDADLAKAKANGKKFTDLKTKKFSSLGNAKWREILSASPAEPGLSRFVELSDGRLSAGGWADLAPALVLKNIGCQQVIYVQREGDESGFATKIAKNVGMSESDWKALYDLGNEDSGYSRSIVAADGVWCTNWNAFKDSEMGAMVLDAFNAPLETRDSLKDAKIPYSRASGRVGKAGCTPGVSGGATFPK